MLQQIQAPNSTLNVPVLILSQSCAKSPEKLKETFTNASGIVSLNPNQSPHEWILDTITSAALAQPLCITWGLKERSIRRPVVIGISGSSRSGKGTATKILQSHFGSKCIVIGGDQFFDHQLIMEKLGGNWDHPAAIRHDAFLSCVTQLLCTGNTTTPRAHHVIRKDSVIILEGFMLYYDMRLFNLMNLRFWIDIDRDTCYTRRMATTRVPEKYFNDWLWPNYLEYSANRKGLIAPSCIFDGRGDPNEIGAQMLSFFFCRVY